MIRYVWAEARRWRWLRTGLAGALLVALLLPSVLPTVGAAAHAAFHAAEALRRSAGPLAHHRLAHRHERLAPETAHSHGTDARPHTHGAESTPHTHGAESTPHTHGPLVDRLRSASAESPSDELAVPGSADLRIDDHVPTGTAEGDERTVIVGLRRAASTPAPTLSAPPPTPPPRA